MRRALSIVLLLVCVLLVYLLFWPVAANPVAFNPAPNPGMSGSFAPNELLRTAQHLASGIGEGPEDVTKGPDGFFYTGLQDGRVVRFREGGGAPETIVNTNGRPLGMHFDRKGHLIVADAFRGLLSISPDKTITVLADTAGGERLLFPDDLDIAPDGVIWFSNASQRYDQRHWQAELLETSGTGSLLSYDPANGKTTVALSGLMFANGVAVGPKGDYVLVTETLAARITRLWIRGPNAGRTDLFLALPGYPDNISFNGGGVFWVGLVVRRSAFLEHTWPRPFLRKVLMRLPKAFLSRRNSAAYSWIIGVSTDGRVLHNYQDSGGGAGAVTSVNEFDGKLYLGSNTASFVSKYSIP